MRVLIITGKGKSFVAGADISGMSDFDKNQSRKFSETGQKKISID